MNNGINTGDGQNSLENMNTSVPNRLGLEEYGIIIDKELQSSNTSKEILNAFLDATYDQESQSVVMHNEKFELKNISTVKGYEYIGAIIKENYEYIIHMLSVDGQKIIKSNIPSYSIEKSSLETYILVSLFFKDLGKEATDWFELLTFIKDTRDQTSQSIKQTESIIVDALKSEISYMEDVIKMGEFQLKKQIKILNRESIKRRILGILKQEKKNHIDIENMDQNVQQFKKKIESLKEKLSKLKLQVEQREYKSNTINTNKLDNFLKSFLSHTKDTSMGEKLLTLAKLNNSDIIFKAYAELVNLRYEIEIGDEDNLQFLDTIIKRANKLINDVYKKCLESREIDTSIDKKYTEEFVKAGALAKAMIHKKNISIDEFNELSDDFSAEKINGGGLLKSKDSIDMVDSDNYIKTEIFSIDDYKMLVDNYTKTYGAVDPGWLQVNLRGIARDLENPDVTFYVIRDKKNDNELLAICKMKKEDQDNAYIGTHYVNPDYQGEFGFGEYVTQRAMIDFKEIKHIHAAVAINNPSLERHINNTQCIGTAIIFETDSQDTSREGINMHCNSNKIFQTKDKKEFSNEKIKELYNNNQGSTSDYSILKLDSTLGKDQDFIDNCYQFCDKGYSMTRLFYERDGNRSDLSQTYVVFEKNDSL